MTLLLHQVCFVCFFFKFLFARNVDIVAMISDRLLQSSTDFLRDQVGEETEQQDASYRICVMTNKSLIITSLLLN